MKRKADVVIVGAGKGERMKAGMNKVLLELRGIPIIIRTMMPFSKSECVNRIILVISRDDNKDISKVLKNYGKPEKLEKILFGGESRADSVLVGLKYLDINRDSSSDVVFVHDAARPFVEEELIKRVLENTGEDSVTVPVLSVQETLRKKTADGRTKVINREELYISQTPQAFKVDMIKECFLGDFRESGNLTDEASYFEILGKNVSIVEGIKKNIKITTKEDMQLAEAILDRFAQLRMEGLEKV